ncbi:MAG: hypothetical protein HY549_03345 [Elusimicrobia bacterium]|nr:hypothetical protein [Elusimicrobiota bacterium]
MLRRFPLSWTVAALSLASLLVILSAPAQYFGRQHDDVLFVIATQALSYGSYRLFTSPGMPPLTIVTPGFPAVLMPVHWLAGDWPAAYQAFCALVLAACPWLAWLWLRRRLDPSSALFCALLLATSPLTLSQSGTVMPEGIYLALFCLWLLVEEHRSLDRWPGPLLLALTQVRPAGFSALPAAVAGSLLARRWKEAALRLAWPAAGAAAWFLWCRAQSSRPHEIFEWSVTFQEGAVARVEEVVWSNLQYYLGSLGSCFLPAALGSSLAALVLGSVLGLLAALGAGRAMAKDRACKEAWALGAAGLMHAFWGWQYERYLIPLIPLLLWAGAKALGRFSGGFLGLLLGLQLIFHGADFLKPGAWSEPELKRTYAWIRENTDPSDVLASLLYARDGYYALRPNVAVPSTENSSELARALRLRQARLVLWQEQLDLGLTGAGSALSRRIDQVGEQLKDGRRFKLLFADPREKSSVYEVL